MQTINQHNFVHLSRRLAWGVLFCVIVVLALDQGLRVRKWAWDNTTEYRFQGDIANAWRQGSEIVDGARDIQGGSDPIRFWSLWKSYLHRYDDVIANSHAGPNGVGEVWSGNYRLDYPPARLLIMSIWVWTHPDDDRTPPEKASPLLKLNLFFELAGCVAAYLVVREVQLRQNIRFATFLALIPALLLWFNAAVIIDAHVWPQWDVWLVPFYLFAAYFAIKRRWLIAGLFLGVGIMFKGQMLITMAIFVLWPLFQWRWRAVLEVVAGGLLSAMLYVSPWMLHTYSAIGFFILMLLVIGCGAYFLPKKWRVLFVCGTVGLMLWFAGLGFGGSFGWYEVAFAFGSRHFMQMTMGPVNNFANLLASHFQWNLEDEVITLHWPHDIVVTMRMFMISIYAFTFLISAIGLAWHDARNDRRMLISLAMPWVLMYAFLGQMHDRYFMWGAAFTALAAGVSLGPTLLHLMITFLACLPMLQNLFSFSNHNDHPWMPFLQAADPDAAWATLLLTCVLLYLAIVPSGRLRVSADAPEARAKPQAAEEEPSFAAEQNLRTA